MYQSHHNTHINIVPLTTHGVVHQTKREKSLNQRVHLRVKYMMEKMPKFLVPDFAINSNWQSTIQSNCLNPDPSLCPCDGPYCIFRSVLSL